MVPIRAMVFIRVALVGALLAEGAPAAPPPYPCTRSPQPRRGARETLDCVQANYDRSPTFRASFRQWYRIKTRGVERVARGTVVFRRPLLFAWRYEDGTVVTSNGTHVTVYLEGGPASITTSPRQSQYAWALAFMLGDHLRRSLRLVEVPDEVSAGVMVVGRPREPDAPFQRLLLHVVSTDRVRAVGLASADVLTTFTYLDAALFTDVTDAELAPPRPEPPPTPLPRRGRSGVAPPAPRP